MRSIVQNDDSVVLQDHLSPTTAACSLDNALQAGQARDSAQ